MPDIRSLAALALAGVVLIQPASASAAQEGGAPVESSGESPLDLDPLARTSPADAAMFCPKYPTLTGEQRAAFWSELLSEVARLESGGNPARTRWRVFDRDAKRPTFRRGLLQISIESARRPIYRCALDGPRSLDNPELNLACGAKILTYWVGRDGVIATPQSGHGARGGGRYWPSLARTATRTRIATRTAALPYCQ